MVHDSDGIDLLHAAARLEYDALVGKEDDSLDKALVDFWRMYSDIWEDHRLLSGLDELAASREYPGVRYFAVEAFPDRQGVIAIIGVKGERILALAFEPCEYGFSELLWQDAKTRALVRARPRAADM
jgi:hypothetical protein